MKDLLNKSLNPTQNYLYNNNNNSDVKGPTQNINAIQKGNSDIITNINNSHLSTHLNKIVQNPLLSTSNNEHAETNILLPSSNLLRKNIIFLIIFIFSWN